MVRQWQHNNQLKKYSCKQLHQQRWHQWWRPVEEHCRLIPDCRGMSMGDRRLCELHHFPRKRLRTMSVNATMRMTMMTNKKALTCLTKPSPRCHASSRVGGGRRRRNSITTVMTIAMHGTEEGHQGGYSHGSKDHDYTTINLKKERKNNRGSSNSGSGSGSSSSSGSGSDSQGREQGRGQWWQEQQRQQQKWQR